MVNEVSFIVHFSQSSSKHGSPPFSSGHLLQGRRVCYDYLYSCRKSKTYV